MNRMNKSRRMQLQAVAVLIGIFFLLLLVLAGIFLKTERKEQPEGEYIKTQDVTILMEAARLFGSETFLEEYVTFGEVMEVLERNSVVFANSVKLEDMVTELERKYAPEHFFLKEDWYILYDELSAALGYEESITRMELVSLGAGTQVTDEQGASLAENTLITADGAYTFQSPDFLRYRFCPVTAYQKDGELLTVYEQIAAAYEMYNVWVMEAEADYFLYFWNNYEIRIEYEPEEAANTGEEAREQIADLTFENGKLSSVSTKMDKVNGKILSVGKEEITVDGIGTIPFSEHLKIYQIYDVLTKRYTGDLRIGYDFTDFVIQDGKVEACLITRDEAMENIRVLINSSNYNTRLHESVTATADTDFVVRYGSYDNPKEQAFQAGEQIEIGPDSEYFVSDRVVITPAALTGKVKLLSVQRSQGTAQYRGQIEVLKTPEGLAVINEVLLEEYLYCVVPSEMPSSYPLEALKTQAVCARTYAYQKMMKPGLPSYGAHVDDSTSFQVYNNIKENVETTKAVRETKGQLLYADNALVEAYYYSTSCGFGTTADIWKSGAANPTYLQAKRIGRIQADEMYNAETLAEEESFRSFLAGAYESDYESTEGWYRWQYHVPELNCEVLRERLQKRLNVDVASFQKVYNITGVSRGAGGVLEEIVIETDKGEYRVVGEYNIRSVLNNGEAKVLRQDGSEIDSPSLLPSAFLVIDTIHEDKSVVGYTIIGGGFGHGVGMSQNGARHMAEDGMNAEQILGFFYEGSIVKAVY